MQLQPSNSRRAQSRIARGSFLGGLATRKPECSGVISRSEARLLRKKKPRQGGAKKPRRQQVSGLHAVGGVPADSIPASMNDDVFKKLEDLIGSIDPPNTRAETDGDLHKRARYLLK